jgi:peptide deformylase
VTNQKILRQKSKEVTEIDQEFLERMALTLEQNPWGIGLSAIQVGRPEQYIVIRLPVKYRESEKDPEFITLINPVITKKYWQEDYMKEGCLSFPRDKFVGIMRPKKITFTATDHDGTREEELEADGILARAIQHEIDHINGILIIDHEEKL